ncbi:hypothetical protein CJD36_010600 [Flavipsychrobacter stenotrophus]|uniref:Uncharacterized protein n=1 Tax=Flavipsychrobacter stenotrophus TaxID=2077091 RepID=A0A2S7SU19_9BACT|nr:hypothetical protein CJD36_010600 [Flavipsychrobacter stenotrophus]
MNCLPDIAYPVIAKVGKSIHFMLYFKKGKNQHQSSIFVLQPYSGLLARNKIAPIVNDGIGSSN